MTSSGGVLENHSLVVRDGRILDLLPSAAAMESYAATVTVQRPAHLLMPGLINANTHAATALFRAAGAAGAAGGGHAELEKRTLSAEFVRDGVLLAIADMLRSGITCFGDRYYFPDETARAAAEQGMRAVIGMPIAETPSPWAGTGAEYLTRALELRDEYSGHPLIETAFAPHAPHTLSNAMFERIATLADELDAPIMIDLHESAGEITQSIARHGVRPILRLWQLGLLTPALNAGHMTHATGADIDLAQRTGISISLCPQASLRRAEGLPPAAAFFASGIRVGLGSGGVSCQNLDLWDEMKGLALMTAHPPWETLAAATVGGAAALGIDAEVGTLAPGSWADVCCLERSAPAAFPANAPFAPLVFRGGRDLVSDVWVAGRQLVANGELTRLDWAAVSARANAWAPRLNSGG
jgi:5-methylthioadenosine/S-adenosylhomocysteine deaminase